MQGMARVFGISGSIERGIYGIVAFAIHWGYVWVILIYYFCCRRTSQAQACSICSVLRVLLKSSMQSLLIWLHVDSRRLGTFWCMCSNFWDSQSVSMLVRRGKDCIFESITASKAWSLSRCYDWHRNMKMIRAKKRSSILACLFVSKLIRVI